MESTVFAWLTEQGPVIAIFGVVIWYQTKRIEKAEDRQREAEEREREQSAARFADVKEYMSATQAMTDAMRALRETIAARA